MSRASTSEMKSFSRICISIATRKIGRLTLPSSFTASFSVVTIAVAPASSASRRMPPIATSP
ncbi:MAG: hypothetical protein IPL89_17180 [Acidobacteria bacterium]|nr:hypothetical protein [Acidobacteriota bacterium]